MIKIVTALGTSWKHRSFLLLLLPFYLTYILAFILTFILIFILIFFLAFILTFILIFYLASILTFYLAFYLLVSLRVRDCIRSSVFFGPRLQDQVPSRRPKLGPLLWILQQRRWPRFFSPPGSYLWVRSVEAGSVLRESYGCFPPSPELVFRENTSPPKKRGKLDFLSGC